MDYLLNKPPVGNLYLELLDFMLVVSDRFYLVVRSDVQYDHNTENILNGLKPFMLNSLSSVEWPGTEILDENKKATIYFYKVTPASIDFLRVNSSDLFQWKGPNYPDDLSFLRKDGSIIVMNTAHEGIMEIDFRSDEVDILRHRSSDSLLQSALVATNVGIEQPRSDVLIHMKKWWMC
jgi:hypothetical protein